MQTETDKMREIGVGVLGFGTVGAGVVEGLQRNGELLATRAGFRMVLRRIADLDVETDRGVAVDRSCLTTDAASVVDAPDVDVLVELIGGTGVARDLVLRALRAGKPVVTANKALLAKHGEEILAAARDGGADVCYEASVGGTIPILRAVREGLVANRIVAISGILNGTCNYILTRMEEEKLEFETVLRQAQAAGYAEADSSLDVDGWDTAHKAAILASLAYGFHADFEAIHVEGIRAITPMDIAYALNLGYRIKLLAVIKAVEDAVEVRVHPALVPLDNVLASVGGAFNAVLVQGDLSDDTLYYGKGAGRLPTASAVLADLVDVSRNLQYNCAGRVAACPLGATPPQQTPMEWIETCYYLRLSVRDRPGVLGRITAILGNHGISIASVLQQDVHRDELVPVIIVTHTAREQDMNEALRQIDALDVVGGPTLRVRIEQ